MFKLLDQLGLKMGRYLSKPREGQPHAATSSFDALERTLVRGDVLLVEGTSRISTTIKYLTQSTWSHAAIYIGHTRESPFSSVCLPTLLEADVNDGVRLVPLSFYRGEHTRICRPVGLSDEEIDQLIEYLVARIGDQYDHKNIFDLARYFLPTFPIPSRWRREMLWLGSGDPTKAICSSLLAEAFRQVNYPILPRVEKKRGRRTRLFSQHHSLFAPRDFDISPYFDVIKPQVVETFDYHKIICWEEHPEALAAYQQTIQQDAVTSSDS